MFCEDECPRAHTAHCSTLDGALSAVCIRSVIGLVPMAAYALPTAHHRHQIDSCDKQAVASPAALIRYMRVLGRRPFWTRLRARDASSTQSDQWDTRVELVTASMKLKLSIVVPGCRHKTRIHSPRGPCPACGCVSTRFTEVEESAMVITEAEAQRHSHTQRQKTADGWGVRGSGPRKNACSERARRRIDPARSAAGPANKISSCSLQP